MFRLKPIFDLAQKILNNMNVFSKSNLNPWGEEIVNKYPLVFLETDVYNVKWTSAGENYINLRYGFECHSGWKEIIENIAKVGTQLVTYLRANGHPDVYIHSCIIKEKFGMLEWQESSVGLPVPFSDLWRAFVGHETLQSAHICEETGKPGRLRRYKNGTLSWIRCLCAEKALEFGYDIDDWEKDNLLRQNVIK